MNKYIIAAHTEDGSVWATGIVSVGAFGNFVVSWSGEKKQATAYPQHVAQSIINDAPDWINKLTMEVI